MMVEATKQRPAIQGSLFDDEEWDRQPTALESARYDEARLVKSDHDAKKKAQAAEAAKIVFGDCLMRLMKLDVPEKRARSMLGKWRSAAKDDALLVRIVQQAEAIGTPDPIPYVTKAIAASKTRTASVANRMGGEWELLGWEAPIRGSSPPKWRGEDRGQVWRDPYGRKLVMNAKKGTVPPALTLDAGIEVE
jgi:hypothetical protein